MIRFTRVYMAVVLLVLLGVDAGAKNVDLSTVPDRDTVQLTIYNSEDLTLVRETRTLSFKPGANPLQFSWAGTLIDPTSVELQFLTHKNELELLDTTFLHDKPHMLYWNVQSEIDGEAVIEITYFTSGISWSADYVAIADRDETEMGLEGFVRVTNNSGEEYEEAQIRLVVGQVNLVEKIAELARVPMRDAQTLYERHARDYYAGAKVMLGKNRGWGSTDDSDEEDERLDEKQIIKEGLSEYFIYTVEGTETIPNGWSKRMRSFESPAVPFKIEYRYRVPEYGNQLVRLYLLTNDKDSTLGESPLPDGVVRVFRNNGRDGLSFLAAQSIKYIPIGDKIELNLGPDPEVIFEWVKLRSWRTHIWLTGGGANVYRRVDDGRVKVEWTGSVAGWDEHGYWSQRIRNYKDKPIEVEVRRTLPGHVVFRNGFGATNHDYQTVEYRAQVPTGETADLRCEIIRHQGRNHKQDNVEVVAIK